MARSRLFGIAVIVPEFGMPAVDREDEGDDRRGDEDSGHLPNHRERKREGAPGHFVDQRNRADLPQKGNEQQPSMAARNWRRCGKHVGFRGHEVRHPQARPPPDATHARIFVSSTSIGSAPVFNT